MIQSKKESTAKNIYIGHIEVLFCDLCVCG